MIKDERTVQCMRENAQYIKGLSRGLYCHVGNKAALERLDGAAHVIEEVAALIEKGVLDLDEPPCRNLRA